MNTLDTTDIDTPLDLDALKATDWADPAEQNAYLESIRGQIINFDNLGVDLLSQIPEEHLATILMDVAQYVNSNYAAIADIDVITIDSIKLNSEGQKIYKFYVLDCLNTILPKFITDLGCTTIEQFDTIVRTRFNNDYNLVKAVFIKTIKSITEDLLKLSRLDKGILRDTSYVSLLSRYAYYLELVDFGDTSPFIINYVRPVLSKYFAQIVWRTL